MTPQEAKQRRIDDLAADGWRPATKEESKRWAKGQGYGPGRRFRLVSGIGLVVRDDS